jgi:hypothetical protein
MDVFFGVPPVIQPRFTRMTRISAGGRRLPACRSRQLAETLFFSLVLSLVQKLPFCFVSAVAVAVPAEL